MPIVQVHQTKIDSTQIFSKLPEQRAKLTDTNTWYAYTADEQTAGQGQVIERNQDGTPKKTRKWASPPDVNVYVTYSFLYPKEKSAMAAFFPHVAGLSVVQALWDLGLKPKIKWPNDVLLNGKKMCGILPDGEQHFVEQDEGKKATDYNIAFLGIGVNVNMGQEECDSIDQPVTSMAIETGRKWDKKLVLARLNEHLERNIRRLLEFGYAAFKETVHMCLETYSGGDIYFDKAGKDNPSDVVIGRIRGITDGGYLLIEPKISEGLYGVSQEFRVGRILRGEEVAKMQARLAETSVAAAPAGGAGGSASAASAAGPLAHAALAETSGASAPAAAPAP